MKQSISGGWYLAFFVVGILLGLLVLQQLDGRDPLALLLPASSTPATTPQRVAETPVPVHKKATSVHTPHSARPVSPPSAARPQPAPHKQAVATPPVAETAVAATTTHPSPALPAPRHEPIACNRRVAGEIREKAREVAEITDYGDHLNVRLLGEWAYYSDSVRRSFVQKFSDSDTCLNGRSRPISFFYQGKTFAVSDPDRGIRFE